MNDTTSGNEVQPYGNENIQSNIVPDHQPIAMMEINTNIPNSSTEPIIYLSTSPGNDDRKEKHSSFLDFEDDDTFHVEINEKQWISCLPKLSLTAATILAAILGIIIGLSISLTNTKLSDDWVTVIGFPGTLWIRALTLLVLPLICLMMLVLPSRVSKIGSIGKYCLPLYLFTSLFAAIEGTVWGWMIRPGSYGQEISTTDTDTISTTSVTALDSFISAIKNAIPNNIIVAFYDMNILGSITFFLTIGILLRRVNKEQRDIVLNISKAILKCCMMAVVWLIWLTPIGMMSLVTVKVAATEDLLSLVKALGFYILTLVIGQIVHIFIFYPLLLLLTTGVNGYTFLYSIYEAPLLAFATSSSAATLPRSLQVAKKIGIQPSVYQFILPLGSCINMDGAALGFPIIIAFLSQLYDVHQTFGTIVLIAVLSVSISVGAAPIPNAGIVYLLMLFQTAHLSEYQTQAIATLVVVDWFVDRIGTAVNVTSDQFVCKIVDVWELKKRKKDISDDSIDGNGVNVEMMSTKDIDDISEGYVLMKTV